ncbi:MAG: DUF928 domain-containing protein [Elainellaceae cyanobacterium]
MTTLYRPILLSAAIALLGAGGVPRTAIAQISFSLPEVSAPGNREARARSTCTEASGPALTAILPETNVGVTLQETPTLIVYIPRNNAQQGELRITEADSELDLTQTVELPPSIAPGDYQYGPALATIPLDTAIAPGKSYRWAFTLVCDPGDRSQDVAVSGTLLRAGDAYLGQLAPERHRAMSELMASEPSVSGADSDQIHGAADALQAYADAGIWHDLITHLIGLAKIDPSYTTELTRIFVAQGLGAIADANVVPLTLGPLR